MNKLDASKLPKPDNLVDPMFTRSQINRENGRKGGLVKGRKGFAAIPKEKLAEIRHPGFSIMDREKFAQVRSKGFESLDKDQMGEVVAKSIASRKAKNREAKRTK